MKTSAQRQHDAEARQASADQAERIPTINERYDNVGPQLSGLEPVRNWHELQAECDRQFAFNCAKQAKLDAIRLIAKRKLDSTTNMEVHAAMNSVIHVLDKG